MSIDPYQVCPCGSGKKIKFCCCADLVGELEKVLRMAQGDQRRAAVEHIDQLLARNPDRAALLSLKAVLLVELGEFDGADAAARQLLAKVPESPLGLAVTAMTEAARGDAAKGAVLAHRALAACRDGILPEVYMALGVVARRFAAAGRVVAARAHLLMQLSMDPRDEQVLSVLLQINRSPAVPLILKDSLELGAAPAGVPWKADFDAAAEEFSMGHWLAAVESLENLNRRVPGARQVLRALAVLRTYLGEPSAAVAALRAYAAHPGLDLDDAVEAEAMAILTGPVEEPRVEVVKVAHEVKNGDALMERILSDKRCPRIPVDPAQLGEEGQPPPRGAFFVLDRPLPASSEGLSLDTIPTVLCDLLVFGRQTDRPARLEYIASAGRRLPAVKDAVAAIAGDLMEGEGSSQTVDHVTAEEDALSSRLRLPDDASPQFAAEIRRQQRRHLVLETWPEVPAAELSGKSLRQAASDPALKHKVLAFILLRETSEANEDFDFNELRTRLGLPVCGPIHPAQVDVEHLPLVRLARLVVGELNDDQLLHSYQAAAMSMAVGALRRLSDEVIRRPSMADKVSMEEVYGTLTQVASTPAERRDHARQAAKAAIASRRSPARWLLNELTYSLMLGDEPEVQRLVDELRTRHLREPGVAESLYSLLAQAGLLRESAAVPEAAAAPAAQAGPAGGIWTPGTPAAPPAAEEGKSKLWMPGME